jgi:putative heme-binding domain-containing protein
VVRVRPDGSGLELQARGTRNILEVAVSPLLDGIARDNTNDGGGWDIRLHHFTGFEDHGYPRLFKNFGDEIIAPLADYGGGSGCGAAWIDEPGIPARWNNAPFTADWGRNWVYRHGLTPKGATFAADQKEFIGVTRTTDLDVDARSRVYVASWRGATFNWAGNDVGYIVQARPKGYRPDALPDFAGATDEALVGLLRSASHRTRLEAQRTLLRRGLKRGTTRSLSGLARESGAPLASRVAAIFALSQGEGAKAESVLAKLAGDAVVAPWAVRALADQTSVAAAVSPKPLVSALASGEARTRREAVVALGRWHGLTGAWADGGTPRPSGLRTERLERHAAALRPRLVDADPVVAHTAMQVMRQLGVAGECFAALDSAGTSPAERAAVLRVLSGIPRADVVSGVVRRLEAEADPARRAPWLTALCRLHFVEGKWTGASWGTRPDTRGPWHQPEPWAETARIGEVLSRVLAKADAAEAAFLAGELDRHRIPAGGALGRLLALAERDPAVRPLAIGQLARAGAIPAEARTFLVGAAVAADTVLAVRGQAIEALVRLDQDETSLRAVLGGLARLSAGGGDRAGIERVTEAVLSAASLERERGRLEAEAARLDAGSSRWADAVLLRMADKEKGRTRRRDGAAPAMPASEAVEAAWQAGPSARRVQLAEASILAGRKVLAAQLVAAAQGPGAGEAADAALMEAAGRAVSRLKLEAGGSGGKGQGPLVGSLKVDDAVGRVQGMKGDVLLGEQVFTRLGCIACHTVKADDPLKGPYLGNIATIYKRRELAEAVLLPNKSIAQGFVANRFSLKDGEEVEGFVVQEATDAITIRNVAAQELKLKPSDIARRDKLEKSLMPEGLAAGLNVHEFASLLDYLESLAAGK